MDYPIGLIKRGYYADLLLVDGDPLKKIDLLTNPAKLLMVMKGGQVIVANEVLVRRIVAAE